MTAIGYTHFQAEVDRLKRERDEAREQANDWHDMEDVATDMYRNRADRLKRMIRIALRWRNWYGNASATAKDLRAQLNDALEISPAMSQAKIDSLNASADKTESEVARKLERERDQAYAPHPHIAAVQPVEPADGVALNEALAEAARVLGIEADSPMWPESRSASACANAEADRT